LVRFKISCETQVVKLKLTKRNFFRHVFFLSSYYVQIFDKFAETLSYKLRQRQTWSQIKRRTTDAGWLLLLSAVNYYAVHTLHGELVFNMTEFNFLDEEDVVQVEEDEKNAMNAARLFCHIILNKPVSTESQKRQLLIVSLKNLNKIFLSASFILTKKKPFSI